MEVEKAIIPSETFWTRGSLYIPYNFRRDTSHLIDWKQTFDLVVGDLTCHQKRLDPSHRLSIPKALIKKIGKPGDKCVLVAYEGTLIAHSLSKDKLA